MGNNYEVGILTIAATLPSIQLAQALGRPVQHHDVHRMPMRQWLANIVVNSRGWPLPTETSETPVMARLDAGRWLADCPLGCRGAEMVSEAEPIFICLSCSSGHRWWPVQFPKNRAAIEAEVIKRVDPLQWSWEPGETLVVLRRQTAVLRG